MIPHVPETEEEKKQPMAAIATVGPFILILCYCFICQPKKIKIVRNPKRYEGLQKQNKVDQSKRKQGKEAKCQPACCTSF